MEAIDRNFLSNDLMTISFFIGIVLVFFMKVYNPKYLFGYTISFFTQGFIEKRAEDGTSVFSVFYSLMFLFSVVIITATLFSLLTPVFFEQNSTTLVTVFIGALIYLVSKYILSYAIMYLFNLKKELEYFFFTKNGYLYTCCLLFFPALIIHQYLLAENTILLFFISLLLIFRLFLILKNNKKLIFGHIFYFILYFCALELAPVLILIKTIN